MFTKVKTDTELTAMRESGRLLATVLATLKEALEPGMTTKDLAQIADRELRGTGGKPAFLGYPGVLSTFPDVLCVSVNDEVVHGVPGKREIQDGDIVSLDFGVIYDGMITDAAITAIAGTAAIPSHSKLVHDTHVSLMAGIDAVHGGVKVGAISAAVEGKLKGYGIVQDLVGHGVGHQLHEDPNIPNYGSASSGPVLRSGMTIAIEPMATLGDYRIGVDPDGWTIRTVDGSWAAHFEHTVLITPDGAEIITSL